MTLPTSSTDGSDSSANRAFNVSTTVTRTVTTTNADGAQETSVHTSTNVHTVKVTEATHESDNNASVEPIDPEHSGPITRVERTEKVIADIPDGLSGGHLGSFEIDTEEQGETAVDSAVQQLLSDMLRAGLKPKGGNDPPNKAKGKKESPNKAKGKKESAAAARMKAARDKAAKSADNNVARQNDDSSAQKEQSKDRK